MDKISLREITTEEAIDAMGNPSENPADKELLIQILFNSIKDVPKDIWKTEGLIDIYPTFKSNPIMTNLDDAYAIKTTVPTVASGEYAQKTMKTKFVSDVFEAAEYLANFTKDNKYKGFVDLYVDNNFPEMLSEFKRGEGTSDAAYAATELFELNYEQPQIDFIQGLKGFKKLGIDDEIGVLSAQSAIYAAYHLSSPELMKKVFEEYESQADNNFEDFMRMVKGTEWNLEYDFLNMLPEREVCSYVRNHRDTITGEKE